MRSVFLEVISNLLIHREFSNPFPAKLVIEKNRVYIENGNKPNGNGMIDPENFSPYPKNPKIAKFFKEIGWVDELGSGVRNIYKYNKIYSGVEPAFIEGDVFKTIIPLTVQDTNQDTNQDNEEIKDLLEFCRTPRTRKEMQEFMGLNNRGHFRKKILNPLIKGKICSNFLILKFMKN
jgi:ATP-dependent DNA helicase RecG